jgi:hypothetical protein
MAGSRIAQIVTVAELARQRGKHPSNIRRWLRELDAKHGGVLHRVGKGRNARLYTTTAALARVAPHLVEPESDVREQVDVMQKDIDRLFDCTARLQGLVRDVADHLVTIERGRT